MTSEQFSGLLPGDRVVWTRIITLRGVVVTAAPIVRIDWENGLRTEHRHWEQPHIELAPTHVEQVTR